MKTEYKIYIFLKKSLDLVKDCISFQRFKAYPCSKCSESGFTFLCKKPIAQEKTDRCLFSEVF